MKINHKEMYGAAILELNGIGIVEILDGEPGGDFASHRH